jgi:exosortase/archaeosortase
VIMTCGTGSEIGIHIQNLAIFQGIIDIAAVASLQIERKLKAIRKNMSFQYGENLTRRYTVESHRFPV